MVWGVLGVTAVCVQGSWTRSPRRPCWLSECADLGYLVCLAPVVLYRATLQRPPADQMTDVGGPCHRLRAQGAPLQLVSPQVTKGWPVCPGKASQLMAATLWVPCITYVSPVPLRSLTAVHSSPDLWPRKPPLLSFTCFCTNFEQI